VEAYIFVCCLYFLIIPIIIVGHVSFSNAFFFFIIPLIIIALLMIFVGFIKI